MMSLEKPNTPRPLNMYFNDSWSPSWLHSTAPWKSFFDIYQFSLPAKEKLTSEIPLRIQKNLSAYGMNYFIISLVYLFIILITHWWLCFIFGLIFFGYFTLLSWPRDQPFFIPFKPVENIKVQWNLAMIIWSIVSLILIISSSAFSAIFWALGSSAITVLLHASFHKADDIPESLNNV